MYNKHPLRAAEFIDDEGIKETLCFAQGSKHGKELISSLTERAANCKGLTRREAVVLLEHDLPEENEKMFTLIRQVKQKLYSNHIIMFAPLYLSNYCINSCVYCPYHHRNEHIRGKKLMQKKAGQEVIALQDMGHKRLALETGEDPVHSPIEYVLESTKTIYSTKHKNGTVRRVNVNIAATTMGNYQKLREAGIGTYILFQEAYNEQSYEQLHPDGLKSNYAYHAETMDHAAKDGINDIGCGVLFGLNMYRCDSVGLLMHAEHLEAVHGVGPHTISVPRICPAGDINPSEFSDAISDKIFTKVVAVL